MIIVEGKDKKDEKGKNNVILDDTPSLKSHFNCSMICLDLEPGKWNPSIQTFIFLSWKMPPSTNIEATLMRTHVCPLVSCRTTSDLYQVVSLFFFVYIIFYINDMEWHSTITRQNDAQNTQKAAVIKECADRYLLCVSSFFLGSSCFWSYVCVVWELGVFVCM